MSQDSMDRRSFLRTGGSAAVATATAAATGVSLTFSWEAFAAELTSLSPEQGRLLMIVSRTMFPHPTLGDALFAPLVKALDAGAEGDAGTKSTIDDGLALLDELAGASWADASDEARMSVLENPKLSALTGMVYGKALTSIYNNPAVWTELGYEGSSAEHGGYLNRGFNDLNWLDAPPADASPKAG